ncbi:MAG: hypothetical protein K6F87_05505, partial [Lachnospiraceae bacterium]|nr:hypothetical protein [Lachnospiraceae bacterium]
MKKITFTTLLIMTMLLAACSNSAQTEEATQPDDTAVSGSADGGSSEKPAVLVTEDDYRNAIASETEDSRKLELYNEFSSSYRMNADEYAEYATLCEKAGDTVCQRKALFALYRMDPSEEHGGMLSNMTLKTTSADDEKAEGLLNDIVEGLKNCEADDFSPESVKSIIASEDWKKSFYIDNGTYTSHTEFSGDAI